MWKKIEKAKELVEGARIKYSVRWVHGGYKEFGDDDILRYAHKSKEGEWEAYNNIKEPAGTTFSEMCNLHMWVDDPAPAPEPVKKPQGSKPVHRGYDWDGVVYTEGKIGENTLAEHDLIANRLRAQLKAMALQRRRYLVLEKRGMK